MNDEKIQLALFGKINYGLYGFVSFSERKLIISTVESSKNAKMIGGLIAGVPGYYAASSNIELGIASGIFNTLKQCKAVNGPDIITSQCKTNVPIFYYSINNIRKIGNSAIYIDTKKAEKPIYIQIYDQWTDLDHVPEKRWWRSQNEINELSKVSKENYDNKIKELLKDKLIN